MQIHHVALRAADCEASLAFHPGLPGIVEVRRVPVWLQAADAVLMLEQALRGHGAGSGSGHVPAFAAEGTSPR